MEPQIDLISREIPEKKKGYVLLRACDPGAQTALVREAAQTLRSAGAEHVYAASTDPAVPLAEGSGLRYVHDMLGMYAPLDQSRPRPRGLLTLEPLTRETGGQWLDLYGESFFAVPNSATYGAAELEQILTEDYRCGFALLEGERVGIYECGFKKEHPEIGSVGLDAAHRGRGLGRELLLTVMEDLADLGCTKCWLQVSTANAPAYALYQSVGFTLDQVLSRWYEVEP